MCVQNILYKVSNVSKCCIKNLIKTKIYFFKTLGFVGISSTNDQKYNIQTNEVKEMII